MNYKLNHREVEIEEMDFYDGTARVIEAYFLDTEEMLTDEELLEFTEIYQELLVDDCRDRLTDFAYAQGE